MEFTYEILNISLLGQKYALRSSHHLNTQEIVLITKVLYCKLIRKNRNETMKDRRGANSKNDVIDIKEQDNSGRTMVINKHGGV